MKFYELPILPYFCSLDKYPLLRVFETGAVTELPLQPSEQQPLDFESLFSDNAFRKSHSFWVKSLAIELFTIFSGNALAEVAAKQTQFSTVMIPLLVKVLLTTKNANHKQTLNMAINRFFAKTFERLTANQNEVKNSGFSEECVLSLNLCIFFT